LLNGSCNHGLPHGVESDQGTKTPGKYGVARPPSSQLRLSRLLSFAEVLRHCITRPIVLES